MRWYWTEHITAERAQLAADQYEGCRGWPAAGADEALKTVAREEAARAEFYASLTDEGLPF